MFRQSISLIVSVTFMVSMCAPIHQANADNVLNLPTPGTMVNLSPAFEPALIKGLTVHKDNPFLFDFIVDTGHSQLKGEQLKQEGDRLINYFFAALTIPEKDLWVNLSPYEKDRMIPTALGETAMGRDLLAQDYMLKQITASLIYPEKELGKKFWDKIYAKAQAQYGPDAQVPVNALNKVWIVAEKASVYEHDQTAFVVNGHLKVMLEDDYLAVEKNGSRPGDIALAVSPSRLPSKRPLKVQTPQGGNLPPNGNPSNIIREIILPVIEEEVNHGKNFAALRQIFNSQILATWFKRNLKQALLSQVYADKSKVNGVNLSDATDKQKIYERYLQAYKKGAFNYVKDTEMPNGRSVPRKYFSGGYDSAQLKIVNAGPDAAMRAVRPEGVFAVLSTALNINDSYSSEADAPLLVTMQAVEQSKLDSAMLELIPVDPTIKFLTVVGVGIGISLLFWVRKKIDARRVQENRTMLILESANAERIFPYLIKTYGRKKAFNNLLILKKKAFEPPVVSKTEFQVAVNAKYVDPMLVAGFIIAMTEFCEGQVEIELASKFVNTIVNDLNYQNLSVVQEAIVFAKTRINQKMTTEDSLDRAMTREIVLPEAINATMFPAGGGNGRWALTYRDTRAGKTTGEHEGEIISTEPVRRYVISPHYAEGIVYAGSDAFVVPGKESERKRFGPSIPVLEVVHMEKLPQILSRVPEGMKSFIFHPAESDNLAVLLLTKTMNPDEIRSALQQNGLAQGAQISYRLNTEHDFQGLVSASSSLQEKTEIRIVVPRVIISDRAPRTGRSELHITRTSPDGKYSAVLQGEDEGDPWKKKLTLYKERIKFAQVSLPVQNFYFSEDSKEIVLIVPTSIEEGSSVDEVRLSLADFMSEYEKMQGNAAMTAYEAQQKAVGYLMQFFSQHISVFNFDDERRAELTQMLSQFGKKLSDEIIISTVNDFLNLLLGALKRDGSQEATDVETRIRTATQSSVVASILKPSHDRLYWTRWVNRMEELVHADAKGRDAAMNAAEIKPIDGGIDLNTLDKGLSVTKDANDGVQMEVSARGGSVFGGDPAMLERIGREGILRAKPVIIQIRQLPSVLPLLGLTELADKLRLTKG